jgi:hypothetical protein
MQHLSGVHNPSLSSGNGQPPSLQRAFMRD